MKIVLGVLGAALVAVLGLLGWMGALRPIEVAERDMGPYQFVYVQEPSGEHGKIDELTDRLAQRLEAAGFDQRKLAHEFFPTGRGVQNKIGFLVQRVVGPDVLGAETFYQGIPVQRYMVAEFPFRNHLSFLVAHFRGAAAFAKHMRGKRYAETSAFVIQEGDRVRYLSPIAAS